MKTIKSYIAIGASVVFLLTSTSCTKEFYTKANNNPNAPGSVPSNTLLSGVEVSLAYTQGGAASQFTSLFTQQTYGAQRQAQAYYDYILTPADPEYLWDQMYTDVMENDHVLMTQAQAAGQNEYYGIANIIMAYSIQTCVDVWGKIPYSTAFQGAGDIQPTFDDDQALYGTVLSLLNTGITALSNSEKGTQYPTNDDVIYGGSESEWIAFAQAVKARIYIHQCKHGNAGYEDSAIADANAAIANGFVTAQVSFGAASNNNAPWYQFNNQRGGYISFAPTALIDSMASYTDPRLSDFADTVGGAGTLAAYYGLGTSPVEFITTEELYFIAAEANVRLSNAAAAQTAYISAITANMTKLGVSNAAITTYLASPQGTLPVTQAAALHQLGVQEWIALYLNPEAWTSYRRLGSPMLAPTAGSEIIRRMIYPNSEVSLNANCPQGVTIFLPRIFWDN